MHLLFLDTETTDIDNAQLIQLAYQNTATGAVVNEYFKPSVPISYGAMAVHHITNEMVGDKPMFRDSTHYQDLLTALADAVAVAHNAPFDIQVLKNEGVEVPTYIDTLRVARHLLKSEQFSLQFLRYSLHLDVQGTAHDALGDITVLAVLFDFLKKRTAEQFGLASDEEAIQKMIELSQTPVLLQTFQFGKYRGKTFAEVSNLDHGYLEWLYNSESQKDIDSQNQEMIFTLKHYLQKV